MRHGFPRNFRVVSSSAWHWRAPLRFPAAREDEMGMAVTPGGKDGTTGGVDAFGGPCQQCKVGWQRTHRSKTRDPVAFDMDPGIIDDR